MKKINPKRYKNGDNSFFEKYKNEVKMSIIAIIVVMLIFLVGRTYIKFSPFFDVLSGFSTRWDISFPTSAELVEQQSDTGWFGEGERLAILRIGDGVKNSVFDISQFKYTMSEDERVLVESIIDNYHGKNINKALLDSKYVRKLTKYDNELIIIYDKSSNEYYLFENLM